ncbi:hypothetical protein [Xenorhabdus griffiniae]|uniref:Amidophosphoribosyltransferase n=1 Tax=Xenorhabdus griffiniae TaxID=351672 RepID=A0ABY9XM91_9GAMM|nr:hypothetical protein [Xenorhabdus griffiniae]MBD1228315.1 hypothetical protein [Xenorhabdus griffiniae]MBE8587752.1 hypothetical protein [Xenorhabdus griffiniae]WMV74048.1 hypothetical protein QL128_08660 [Xenorhabdus griffiniae]WNH03728.1 hypothetical protein QL112_008665 [Xenorhabdus griffiniae]
MTYRLTQIDELTRNYHYHLTGDDVCYYYGEYTSGRNYIHSDTNQLIWNLKKSVRTSNPNELRYKQRAIFEVAQLVARIGNLKDITFVPVPPSKCETDPEYDNRMEFILKEAKLINPELDYRKLITQRNSMAASHTATNRPSPEEIAANYIFDSNLAIGIRPSIVIFDDVLTAGSHYKAMKTVIKQHIPHVEIIGLFIARTVRESDFDDFDDLTKQS